MARKQIKNNKHQIYQIVMSAILLALSIVMGLLSKLIPFFRMPSGGSLSLSMIPLTLSGLILGPIYGLVTGFSYGLINMLVDGAFSYGPLCLLFDYFLAYASGFVCGFFRKYYYKNNVWSFVFALSSFILLRLLFHTLSGIIVFNDYLEETGKLFSAKAISFSLIYNASYLIPTFIVSLILLIMLSSTLFRLNKSHIFKILGEKYISDENEKYIYDIVLIYLLGLSLLSYIISLIPFSDDGNTILLSYVSLIISFIIIVFSSLLLLKKDIINYDTNQKIRMKLFKNNYFLYIILDGISLIIYSISLISIAYF